MPLTPLAPLAGDASPARLGWLAHQLSRLRIRTRITALMLLAALVAALLAALGIRGLAASKESLRVVYEDRMTPVRNLSEIGRLMLSNQLQMQLALVQASPGRNGPVLTRSSAYQAAEEIEHNVAAIDALWRAYLDVPRAPTEQLLAQQFGERRSRYLREAVAPGLAALRALDYTDTQRLALNAKALYEQAYPDVQTLIRLQFEQAQAAYQDGVQRYHRTGWLALGALLLAMALLGRLGALLIRSIATPLQQMIALCARIAAGRLDNPIPRHGRDEISAVFRALHAMQQQLADSAQAVHRLAYFDPLTELPNRTQLRQAMEQALQAQDGTSHGALLLIDLDNFKAINDSLGHEIGDQHLQHVARQLRDAAGAQALVARLGGDEFVLLAQALDSDEQHAQEQVRTLALQVLTAVVRPVRLAGRQLQSSASIGVCLFRPGTLSGKELLKRADTAMYQAKNAGRSAYRFYDPVLQAQQEARAALEAALRSAIGAQQLALHYQLQVDAQRQPIGVEALLRWQHPLHGPVSPAQFIPIAEDSDLILELGDWVLHAACAQLRAWADEPLLAPLTMSVNVSARQFAHSHFTAHVQAALRSSGAEPQKLVLELTESMVLHDVADTVRKMQELRRLGVRFALDDFGTGHSSLSQLQRLPLYQLKIDRSFIQDMGAQAQDTVIVQTIIGMAHNLGLDVVAEGVENEAQYAALLALHCPSFQGYLFAAPQTAGTLHQLLRSGAPLRRPLSVAPPPAPPAPLPQPLHSAAAQERSA